MTGPVQPELELDPDPTPVEFEVVVTALAETRLLAATGSESGLAWRSAGVRESVERVPQAPPARSSRGATRA